MPEAVRIAKAINKTECGPGGICSTKGASGENGHYQIMPSTWKLFSKEILGYVAPQTEENEYYVVVKKIQKWHLQGMSEYDIFLSWNAGSPIKVKGVNKYGVKYDSVAYANTAMNHYLSQ